MLTKSEILKFNYHQVIKQLTLRSVLKLLRFEDVKNSLSAAPSEVSCFFVSGGRGQPICSEAVWVIQTRVEKTGHTLTQAGS